MLVFATDAILVLVLVEAIAFAVIHRVKRQGPAPHAIVPTLAAGFFLVLALRASLGGTGSGVVAASLLASLVAHCIDLATRWRR